MRLSLVLAAALAAGCAHNECMTDHVAVTAVDAAGAPVAITSLTWTVDGGAEETRDCTPEEGDDGSACTELYAWIQGDGHYVFTVVSGEQTGTAELDVVGSGQHASEANSCADVYSETVEVVVE